MSRIGKKAIEIPKGAKISVNEQSCTVEGPKGKLTVDIPQKIKVSADDEKVAVTRENDTKKVRSFHGLVRNLIRNAFVGVTEGYTRTLEIHGIGFKAQLKGKILNCVLGYSHEIDYKIPDGVNISVPQPTTVVVESIDKVLVGRVAAQIRDFYLPEPYKGKGVRYANEQVRRKQGKVVG